MAVILTSEYTANTGYDYKVEVINSKTGTPLANTFKVQDVTVTYSPQTDDILSPIIPSTAEILCWNEGGYFNSTFIPALIQNQQETFQVKIYQDTGSGYNLFWFGWVLQDQVEEVEQSQPRSFVLKCVDGLGRLQDQDFTSINDVITVPQRSTFVSSIIKCLGFTGLTDLFGTSDAYLVTSCDWFEDSMTYSTGTDPLILAFLDLNIFRIKGEDGSEVRYTSVFDVLAQLATLWNCRVYQSNGLWRFEQLGQRDGTTLKENIYRKAGIQIANAIASYEYTVDRATDLLSARAAGNNETFLPACKFATLNYEQEFMTRNIGQFYFNSTTSAQTVGVLEGLTGAGLSITVDYFAGCTISTAIQRAFKNKATFEITLTLETQAGVTYYYRNSNGGEWTLTSSVYTFESKQERPINADFVTNGSFNLTTKELPANGNVTLNIELDDFVHRVNDNWISTTTSASDWSVFSAIELDSADDNVKGAIYSAKNNSSSIGDANTLNLGTINIGDSLFSTGRIMIDNGGTFEKTSQWREGNTGSYLSILQLLVNESLAYFNDPVHVYDGDLYHSNSYQYRLGWDSDFYLPMDCSFSTQEGIWSGRWFAIVRDKTNVASETRYDRRKRLFRRTTANANPSDLPDGKIGGAEFTENKGQFDNLYEYELTSAMINAGLTGSIVIPAQGASTYIDVSRVVIENTSGTNIHTSATAQLYFASETTQVVTAATFLNAINNGFNIRLNSLDGKLWPNEALLIDVGSSVGGDFSYNIKIYYKLIS